MAESEEKMERGKDYSKHFTPGAGQGGPQSARGIGFRGDEMGVPSDDIEDHPFRLFSQPEARVIPEEKQTLEAEVCFSQGTVIFPINPINNRPRGGRILQETLYANRVYDKKGKPKRIKRLSLWQAVSEAGIWNGKLEKEFIICSGHKFTAYVKNAENPENKK